MHPVSGDELADFFATLLRVPREALSTSTHVLELGADSIMLLEARTWIEARHGSRIEIRRFFEDLNTIDAIAAFLATQPPAAGEAARTASPGEPAAPATAAGHPGTAAAGFDLMRAQLALVADVIEAQNRAIAALRQRPDPTRPDETAIAELETTAA